MRKYIVPVLALLILLFTNNTSAWGYKGHSLINKKAVESLPSEMNGFKKWADFITEHASDPDKRRDSDSTEFPKHFIDIDFYKEFRQGKMVEDKAKLSAIYSDSTVRSMGILPWATINTFNNLVEAFKSKDKAKSLLYASDLGHYVADAHQPMHNIMNYDGQLTGQKGIHARYEEKMIDMFSGEMDNIIDPFSVKRIDKPLEYIFTYIFNSNSVAPVLFDADNFAFKESGSRENESYYNILWFRTKYVTKIQFNMAAQDLASLIYTAWIKAGKPSFKNFK
jgi:hypothetical protein